MHLVIVLIAPVVFERTSWDVGENPTGQPAFNSRPASFKNDILFLDQVVPSTPGAGATTSTWPIGCYRYRVQTW